MNWSSGPARFAIAIMILAGAQLSCDALTPALGSTAAPASAPQSTLASSPAPSACDNDVFPVKTGATWTYSGQFNKEAYTRVVTVSNLSVDSFAARTQITDASGNTLVDTTDTWQCTTAGLIEPAGPLGATLQSAAGSTGIKVLSASGVTIPTQIKAGDKWGQVTQLEMSTGGTPTQTTLTYEFTAFGAEQVTVPAGTFNAMKVQVRASTQAMISGQSVAVTVSGFEWFAPGVGHVKSSETVYAFGIPFASEEGELQSHTAP